MMDRLKGLFLQMDVKNNTLREETSNQLLIDLNVVINTENSLSNDSRW